MAAPASKGAPHEGVGTRPQARRRIRVIPTLLLDAGGRLVKTVRFGKRAYIGDPINTARIFNSKEVDELILLDIDATRLGRGPSLAAIEDIVSEAFMPIGYGGGVRSMDDVAGLFGCGIEKVIFSSCLEEGLDLVSATAARFGGQAAVVCLPVAKPMIGDYAVRTRSGRRALKGSVEEVARAAVAAGAGEIIVYSIDRDGAFSGYDIPLLKRVSSAVDVPVVACGGAGGLDDFRAAVVEGGCSAVAAGSFFVFQSEARGVLISYPTQQALEASLFSKAT